MSKDNKKNICIIGNDPRILKSKKGSLIDEFDYVVRFNRSPIEGYEESVGTKTDFRFANRMVWYNGGENKKEDLTFLPSLRNQTIIVDKDRSSFNEKTFYKVFDKSCSHMSISRNQSLKILLKNKLPQIKFNNKNCTGGMAVIAYFLNENYDVTIHGFGLNKNINKKIIPHFYETKHLPTDHNYKYEVKILNLLIKKGIIKTLED